MNWYRKFLKWAAWRNSVRILSQAISYYVFKYIIDHPENIRITIDQTLFPDLSEYKTDYIYVNIIDAKINYVTIPGEYRETPRVIIANVYLNRQTFSKQIYEMLRRELKYEIRHELEHSRMIKINPNIPSSSMTSDWSNIMAAINHNKTYLLNEGEMNSYIRELMDRAIDEEVSIESLIENLLIRSILFNGHYNLIENEINNKTSMGIEILKIIEEIRQKYITKINQIYANRKGKYAER